MNEQQRYDYMTAGQSIHLVPAIAFLVKFFGVAKIPTSHYADTRDQCDRRRRHGNVYKLPHQPIKPFAVVKYSTLSPSFSLKQG